MRRYSCSNRMCGAEDCALCHPELQRTAECACCGASQPLFGDWYGPKANLCPDCSDKITCDGCGEYFDQSQLQHGLCHDCENMAAAG